MTVERADEEAVLSILSEQAPVGVCIMQDGKFSYVNSKFPIAIGYTAYELLGKDALEIVVPEDRQTVNENTEKMLKGELLSPYQFRVICKDGGIVWVMATVKSIQYRGRRATLGNYMEITGRRQIEEALKESEQRYRELAGSITDVFFAMDEHMTYTYWNRASEILTGIRAEDAIGRSLWEVFPDKPWRKRAEEVYRNVLRTRQPQTFVNDYDIDARRYVLEINAYPSRGGISVFVKDITGRQRAEEARREAEEEKSALLEEAPVDIVHTDLEGKILYVNQRFESDSGYSREEVIGKSGFKLDWFPPGTLKFLAERMAARLDGRPAKHWETQFKCKDGQQIWIELEGKVLHKSGVPVGFQIIATNITERKQAEEKLKESEQKYRLLFETSPDYITQVDREGRYLAANPATARSLGVPLEQLIGKKVFQVMPREIAELRLANMRKVLDEGRPQVFEDERAGRYFNHMVVPLTTSNGKKVVQVITRDITERKQAEEKLRQSKERYRALFDSSVIGTLLVDAETMKVVIGNQAAAKMFGFNSAEQGIGVNLLDFVPLGEKDKALELIREELLARNSRRAFDLQVKTKDGKVIWISATGARITHKGRLAGLLSFTDITERKQAEEALRQSEERYRTILEEMQEGYYEVDLAGNFTFVNEAMSRILGYSRGELIGMNYKAYTSEQDIQPIFQAYNRVYRTGQPMKWFPMPEIRKDGTRILAEDSVFPLWNEKGEISGFRGISRDITERKKMEEVLRRSEERYRTILEEMEDSYFEVDLGGHFTFVNNSTCRNLGYSREELTGISYKDFTAQEDIEPVFRVFNEVYLTGMPNKGFPWRIIRKDGVLGFAEASVSLLRNDKGEIVGFRGVGRDVTERKKMEEALRQSEENYRALFDSSVIGTFVLDAETMKVVMGNEAAAKMFGLASTELAIGTNLLDSVPPDDKQGVLAIIVKELFEQDLRRTHELQVLTKDGRRIWVSVTGARIIHGGRLAGLISFADITEQKRQNERLMMTDRLASIGELAAGAAHELNNPLTSIIGFSELLMEKDTPDYIRNDLALIRSEAQRAANVTNNLLTFARKHRPTKQPTQINDVIEDVLKLRAYAHKSNCIMVERHLAPDLPEVPADHFQMQQVFLNIIINGEYFMTQAHKNGRLTITTKRQANSVMISFADDGPGIPAENLRRIFDPFFTTKDAGKGTGLGLSICHGIVTEHGGQIYATSRPGEGATIFIELPTNGCNHSEVMS